MERRAEPREQLRVAVAQRQFAVAERVRIRTAHEQRLVEAEVAATCRRLLRLARSHGGPALGFLNQDFLDVADRATLYEAIVRAAGELRGVSGVDLQQVERGGTLRMVASLGFTDGFLARFRSLEPNARTACVLASLTRRPVMVDCVERSVIFAGSGALDPMMDAGSRSVYSYPLMGSRGEAAGVISFHARRPIDQQTGAERVAQSAAVALARHADPVPAHRHDHSGGPDLF